MGNRGRKSADAMMVRVDGRSERIKPPTCLGADERKRFIEVVNNCPPDHFRRTDVSLLARFCEADALAEQAAEHLRNEGAVVDRKANPWLVVQEKSVRALTALSMRLRLSPQSRLDPKTIARQPELSGKKPWEI
jgi:P27 family predicted phage terminase small subunit